MSLKWADVPVITYRRGIKIYGIAEFSPFMIF
jgi:hypothetical protein